ncbi:hemolysin family protein [Methylocella sp.]|uniref:hemolysin family protein n=1 Tax=Methylocella sp. TaxID=1978226 RepID=UPI00378527B4
MTTIMSERDSPAAESGADRPSHRPSLFDRLRAVFGGGVAENDELHEALAETDDMSPRERAMLKNVLGLRDTLVEDVMVPRADIIALPIEVSVRDALAAFRSAGHSRLPVHGDTLDDPRGMIHIRDLVSYLAAGLPEPDAHAAEPVSSGPAAADPALPDLARPIVEAHLLRPVLFVPPSMPAIDLLVKMQATRTHMALVIDEYGGVDGLASIEDIVEVIVGDIEDEHDFDESPKIEPAPGGGFFVDARAQLEDVSEAIGADLNALADAEDVDTLGGLIATRAGHVPAQGESFAAGPFLFEIVEADPRRVRRVHVRLRGAQAPEAGAGAGGGRP